MKQAVAVAVLATMLLVLSAPVLAGGWGNEFYPGDAPPSANDAGHHDGSSASCGGGGNVCNTDGTPGKSGDTSATSAGPKK